MPRFHLHPACSPFTCGRCGAAIDDSEPVVTRDDLDICTACDDLADEEAAAAPAHQSPHHDDAARAFLARVHAAAQPARFAP
jgi:hypothetical protein